MRWSFWGYLLACLTTVTDNLTTYLCFAYFGPQVQELNPLMRWLIESQGLLWACWGEGIFSVLVLSAMYWWHRRKPNPLLPLTFWAAALLTAWASLSNFHLYRTLSRGELP